MSEKVFVIVDSSNLIYRSAYANKTLTTSKGKFSGHIFGIGASLFAFIRNQLQNTEYKFVFCYDGKNAKAYRQTILPTYKGNREPREFDPLPEGVAFLQLWPGLHIEQEGFEGDDAMAFAVHMRQGKPCIVLSGDRDLWSLMEHPNCKIWSPNLKRFVENSDISKEYRLYNNPGRVYLAKALFGDASDNIKGIDRLIKKQFDEALNADNVDTPIDFYDWLGPDKPSWLSNKTWDKLQAGKDRVYQNYQVVLPRLDFDKASVTQVFDGNWALVKKALEEYECYSLLKEVG